MIASFEHRYIFIKTNKVAGTSIEMALSRSCGPDDIITPIYPRDEVRRGPAMRYPQNFSTDPALEALYVDAARRRDVVETWKLFRALEPKSIYYNHMTAAEIRERIGEDFWDAAFKFTVERNPFERVVSNAFWKIRDRNADAVPTDAEIGEAIEAAIDEMTVSSRIYAINGAIAVDCILRYENLEAELASIADRIGGDISRRLPRAKSGTRRSDQTAAALLTKGQKRRIVERHAATFELMGYPRDL